MLRKRAGLGSRRLEERGRREGVVQSVPNTRKMSIGGLVVARQNAPLGFIY